MNDSFKITDLQGQPPRLDRRGFLRRAETMAAGGLAAAVLRERWSVAASSEAARRDTPGAPMARMAGARPEEPYFFRIETMGGHTAAGRGGKEV